MDGRTLKSGHGPKVDGSNSCTAEKEQVIYSSLMIVHSQTGLAQVLGRSQLYEATIACHGRQVLLRIEASFGATLAELQLEDEAFTHMWLDDECMKGRKLSATRPIGGHSRSRCLDLRGFPGQQVKRGKISDVFFHRSLASASLEQKGTSPKWPKCKVVVPSSMLTSSSGPASKTHSLTKWPSEVAACKAVLPCTAS